MKTDPNTNRPAPKVDGDLRAPSSGGPNSATVLEFTLSIPTAADRGRRPPQALRRRTSLFVFFAAAFLAALPLRAIPVFPGAVGFGTATPAGRGGVVCRVENLHDKGPGSFRDAVENPRHGYPRVVVFEVGGMISLEADLNLRHGFVTIAGQTAPSPGITLEGGGIAVQASDILIQHLAIRPGIAHPEKPGLGNRDCVKVEAAPGRNINNVVIDHVSGSWASDETFSTWGNGGATVRNVTVSNCLFAEALRYSGRTDSHANNPPKYGHSAGVLFGRGSENITYYRCISAFNMFRNPYTNHTATNIQIVNNLTFAPGRRLEDRILMGADSGPTVATVRGNLTLLTKPSLATGIVNHLNVGHSPHAAQIYIDDTVIADASSPTAANPPPYSTDPWDPKVSNHHKRTTESIRLAAEPPQFAPLGVPVLKSADLPATLTRTAGARPADRDPVDRRLIATISDPKHPDRNRDWIDQPADVGGYPALQETHRRLDLPAQPNARDATGYTALERWLHRLAAEVERK
jgi:hypothetical protein